MSILITPKSTDTDIFSFLHTTPHLKLSQKVIDALASKFKVSPLNFRYLIKMHLDGIRYNPG